jgi:coenzyme F420-dependent glucose-6-phosphate dehydrogenase
VSQPRTAFGWTCALEAREPEQALEDVIEAERLGFDFVLAPDAFHPWTDDGASSFLWAWLGAVAARTTRIQLMTAVTSPATRYHPAVLAQASATVANLSRGRLIVGVGIGDPIHYLPFGIGRQRYSSQAERLSEAVGVMSRLLAGEQVSKTMFDLREAKLYSLPPSPTPIYVAASGPRSAALAATIGDGLIVSVKEPRRARAEVVEPFRTAAERLGRSKLPVVATKWCVVAGSTAEALEALGPMRGMRVPGRGTSPNPSFYRAVADAMDPADLLAQWTVVEDADGLVAAYTPLVESLGADVVGMNIASSEPQAAMRLLVNEVLPQLSGLQAEGGSE